ncbi:MAG: PDZ domain-containing protein [Cyanobacteria bacterium SZAS TMP-1]|nr:PDZ domain-containing protein [Cyanobacteria bacterium SZAS TMP-1]
MKYGPALPPDQRRFGWLIRLTQTVFLGGAAAILLVIALSLYLLPGLRHVSPQELYHTTWAEARASAYDTSNYKDWDQWEHKYDGQIKTDEDAVKFSNEMLKSTGDHYARLFSAEESRAASLDANEHFVGIGVKLKPQLDSSGEPVMAPNKDDGPLMAVDADGNPLLEDIIAGGPAEKAGLKAGDAIAAVDGRSLKNATMLGMRKEIAGKEGETITLTVVRKGQTLPPVKVTRAQVKQEKLSYKMLTAPNGKSIGYIRLEDFMDVNAPEEMDAALKALPTDRLIIDLRSNPGGLMPICLQLASMFVDQGTLVSTRTRIHDAGYETTRFVLQKDGMAVVTTDEDSGKVSTVMQDRLEPIASGKQVIILVDGNSASAAEMFTAALQQNGRATVVGEQSFGKGIGQTVMRFPNGTEFHVTTFRYFTPNGFWLGNGGNGAQSHEQFGITPDHKVPFNKVKGARYGSPLDNQLNFAIDQLSR